MCAKRLSQEFLGTKIKKQCLNFFEHSESVRETSQKQEKGHELMIELCKQIKQTVVHEVYSFSYKVDGVDVFAHFTELCLHNRKRNAVVYYFAEHCVKEATISGYKDEAVRELYYENCEEEGVLQTYLDYNHGYVRELGITLVDDGDVNPLRPAFKDAVRRNLNMGSLNHPYRDLWSKYDRIFEKEPKVISDSLHSMFVL